MNISNKDILRLIAGQIDDLETWNNFTLINKNTYKFYDQFTNDNILDNQNIYFEEDYKFNKTCRWSGIYTKGTLYHKGAIVSLHPPYTVTFSLEQNKVWRENPSIDDIFYLPSHELSTIIGELKFKVDKNRFNKMIDDDCFYFQGTFKQLVTKYIDYPWEYNLKELEEYMGKNKDRLILVENSGWKYDYSVFTEKIFFIQSRYILDEIIRELKYIEKLCDRNQVYYGR